MSLHLLKAGVSASHRAGLSKDGALSAHPPWFGGLGTMHSTELGSGRCFQVNRDLVTYIQCLRLFL